MGILKNNNINPASFRDPSGFIFSDGNLIYRQINLCYKEHYDHLINSGLYEKLVNLNLLIPHEELDVWENKSEQCYKIIKPKRIPFISYPYEWCFSQLKDAALAVLEINKIAFEYGMALKDATAYNVQFLNCKPILIDTLSFEKYQKGKPWVAYRQFCQHFFAPLILMKYKDVRLNQLSRIYLDGIPLNLASSLLSKWTYLKFSIFAHVHLHAKYQDHYADKRTRNHQMRPSHYLALIDNLEKNIQKLQLKISKSFWSHYYKITNYSPESFKHKKQIVAEFIDDIKPKNIWDLGSNIGAFSELANERGIHTISLDNDPITIETCYSTWKAKNKKNILPLIMDLTNPSPGIGWEHEERMSLIERGPVDMLLALALIHHLTISHNLPFQKVADFFRKICRYLVVEFVPKDDTQVSKLLANRDDLYVNYTQSYFEKAFSRYFNIIRFIKIRESKRIIYLMRNKGY